MTVRLNKYLRRYTELKYAKDILEHSHLVLLDPSKWEDKNDLHFIELYKKSIGASSFHALCCTMASETFHHWKIFTDRSEGICVEFDREKLTASLNKQSGLIANEVIYSPIKKLRELKTSNLPFLKRVGYSDEREWRIISSSENLGNETIKIPIDLDSISRIIFNPWIEQEKVTEFRKYIKENLKRKIKVSSSGLTNSPLWKKAGEDIGN